MKTTARPHRTLPMPLWLQGTVELALVALTSYLAVVLILTAIWYTKGFNTANLAGAVSVAGHIWLLIHGVPLHLEVPEQGGFAAISGTMSLVPLGLTLIPLALCYRSGRRLARASYEGQFWQPLAGGMGAYATAGAGISLLSNNQSFSTHPVLAALAPLCLVILGLMAGGYAESRSLAAMIGVNAADWVKNFSQYSRWAGSYLWALVRSALVGLLAFVLGGALLLTASIFWHWDDVVALYQTLHAGAVGGAALTLLQLGLILNLVVYSMAWSTGAGFSLGEGTRVDLTGTEVGVLPSLPLLGALPHASEPWGYLGLALPLLAGAVGGWWFFREGENHFDEWMSLKIRFRWISWPLSTLGLGLLTLVPTFLVVLALGWCARGSLGIGRFTAIGPDPLIFAAHAAVLLAAGAMLGLAAAHLFIRDTSYELERFADEPLTRAEKKAARTAARAEARAQRQAAKAAKKAKKQKVEGKDAPAPAEGEGPEENPEVADTSPETSALDVTGGGESETAGDTEAGTADEVATDEAADGLAEAEQTPDIAEEESEAAEPAAESQDGEGRSPADEAEPAEEAKPFRPVLKRPQARKARRERKLQALAEEAHKQD
ncbi:DUF6350 family protein [Rothia nasimurium]|uniref:cell division protein PerM n=1 Tax=Rothia nasimurium TaxID=85336 RepID=UPI003B9EEC12